MTCERVVPLDIEPAIAEVGAIADLLDLLSVAAESVNIKPGEPALIADQHRDRRDELLEFWNHVRETRRPPLVCVMAAKMPERQL